MDNHDRLVRASMYVLAIAVIFAGLLIIGTSKAADELYACRTDRPDLIQIEFHNFQPTFGKNYWYLGDAGYIDPAQPNVLVVQALTAYEPVANCQGCVDEINHIVNGMAIVGNQDYSVEMVGTADTPLCGEGAWYVTMSGTDYAQLPDQGQGTTSEPTPAATQAQTQVQAVALPPPQPLQPTTCPFMEINFYTNEVTCH